MTSSSLVDRAVSLARFDSSPRHRQPKVPAMVVATALSVAISLLADALLVVIGTAVFPQTKGYQHFQFGDYAKLTVLGVVVACVAWPVVARWSSAPRWIFFRLAIVVTVVLLIPDVGLLVQGQSGRAVSVLVAMHLAIALVTYNVLVHLAPVGAAIPPKPPAKVIR